MYNKDKKLGKNIPKELDYNHILLGEVNDLYNKANKLKALVDKIVRNNLL
jgi:hypothetical protein